MRRLLFCLLAAVAALVAGCSDETAPATTTPVDDLGVVDLTARVDPSVQTFLIEALTRPPAGPIELIGANVVTDADSLTVAVDVVIHNLGDTPLPAPAFVWVRELRPREVVVANADVQDGRRAGFDYSASLGDDAVLSPGETSGVRTWVFRVPALAPFQFSARAEFGETAAGAHLGGRCYLDRDRDGRPSPGEPPLPGGRVVVDGPDGRRLEAPVGPRGHYAVPIDVVGLWSVRYQPPQDGLIITTANPLQVVLLAGPDGGPQSHDHADFGACPPDSVPPCRGIAFSDSSVAVLQREPWLLGGLRLEGDRLILVAGYSGCQPHHRFRLFMAGEFLESDPVQANLAPVHATAEDCDAAFQHEFCFDLGPLCRAYHRAYGRPGVVQLVVHDFQGEQHRLELMVP
jgi:hypothetical protein